MNFSNAFAAYRFSCCLSCVAIPASAAGAVAVVHAGAKRRSSWRLRHRRPLPRKAQSPVLRQDVNLVNVLFSVFDKNNKIVANMERGDFTVFDDNAKQDIRFFSHQSDLPLRVGLLMDTSNSIRQRLEFGAAGADRFYFQRHSQGQRPGLSDVGGRSARRWCRTSPRTCSACATLF